MFSVVVMFLNISTTQNFWRERACSNR